MLVIGRIGWLIARPPPPSQPVLTALERRASRAVHLGLYGILLAFPISGYLISQGPTIDFDGFAISRPDWAGSSRVALWVHAWALPAFFYATLLLHIGAVVKRHFVDRDISAVRRMLR